MRSSEFVTPDSAEKQAELLSPPKPGQKILTRFQARSIFGLRTSLLSFLIFPFPVSESEGDLNIGSYLSEKQLKSYCPFQQNQRIL